MGRKIGEFFNIKQNGKMDRKEIFENSDIIAKILKFKHFIFYMKEKT